MKNLYSRNEFLNIKFQEEMINEGFLSKIFKSLWQGVVKLAKKIKGTNEINKIYDKYKNLLDQTFSKLKNLDVAGSANVAANPKIEIEKQNASFLYNEKEKFLNEADEAPVIDDEQNKEEQKKLVNLDKNKIDKVTKITEDRVTELKGQFTKEIDSIVAKLSKNPEYSSDKLQQYANVMKNQFNSYLYDQWYGFYQNAGDKNKVLELTKLKKESDVNFKKSLDELNAKLGEQQKEVQVKKGKTYTYFSKNNNRDIEVQVIGTELGKDEKGQLDATNKEHNTMWKVKSAGATFWIPPSEFKKEIIPQKTMVKKQDIKVGDQYIYTKKDGQPGIATIVKGNDGNPIIDDNNNVTVSGGKTQFPINISKLRPK